MKQKDIDKFYSRFNHKKVEHCDITIKLFQYKLLRALQNERIGRTLKEDEYYEELLPSNSSHFKVLDPDLIDTYEDMYYYSGPNDNKTREFCSLILEKGKFFTEFDMDLLSEKAGHDVLLYQGSYNCRHRWILARIKTKIKKGEDIPLVTKTDINAIGKTSIENL